MPRTALELGAALFPWRARPGVAIEIVRRVAEDAAARRADRERRRRADVLDYLARTTGLSRRLITLDEPLDADEVEAAFAARVIGQPVATRAAADVILKVRAGLADPGRPVVGDAVHRARPAPARPSSRPRSPSTCTAISRGSCASTWARCRGPTRSRA